jgi:hypothetical protein
VRGNGSKLAAIAITVVTVVTWLWTVIARDLTQRYTRGERPGQFSGSLDSDLLDDYGLVFGIAHNAGDHLETTQTAIDHNADAVEIDVVLIRGQLYAAHAAPQRIAAWLFRGTLLEDSWQIAIQADAVALDLKDETSEYEDAVVNFIEQHPHEPIVLYSRSIDSLSRLRERLPDVHLYLSVPDRATFDETMPNHPFAPRLDGVTIQHDAIDASVVATIRANNQRIIAWTVNDLPRVNELVRLGVDGITSDNLAILRLLGGRQRVEPLLTRRVMSDEVMSDE